MEDFIMKPKVDMAFKEIMMDEKARIGFLSAMLKIRPEDIKETHILSVDPCREGEYDSQGLLDIKLFMKDDTEIVTEIQMVGKNISPERSFSHLCKLFLDQSLSDQGRNKIKKYVAISILDFKRYPGEENFYSCFHIGEDTRKIVLDDSIELHVLELPKLPKELREGCSNIELWARFINAERKEEFDMLAQKDTYIASAYEQLQVVSQDREKRLEYEAREKAIRDYNQMMLEAEERGEERINKLNAFLIQDERFDDLKRSTNDKDFQRQLMEQYGI